MRLTNEFDSALSVEQIWDLLTDTRQRHGMMPDIDLRHGADGLHRGTIELAVGRDLVRYDATATIIDLDRGNGICVVGVEGVGASGLGDLSGTVTVRLTESGRGSVVYLEADVKVTGRVAQMGRGALGDASHHLARQLEASLARHATRSPALDPPPLVGRDRTPSRHSDSVVATSLVRSVALVASGVSLLLLWRWTRRRRPS